MGWNVQIPSLQLNLAPPRAPLSLCTLPLSVKVELRKDFQAQEVALQRSLSRLRSEVQKAQEEARENRDKTNRLQTSLANAEGTIQVGVRCLSEGRTRPVRRV